MTRLLPLLFLLSACADRAEDAAMTSEPAEEANAKKTIMAVFAHPDDESFVLPLLHRYKREGHEIRLVIATDGQNGVNDHTEIPAGPEMIAARAEEARCVSRTLGIAPPDLLGYIDGYVANDWEAYRGLHADLDSLIGEYRPDVLITWGGDGATGHPDHRMVGNVVTEVFQKEGTDVDQLFYVSLPRSALDAVDELKSIYSRDLHMGFHTTRPEYLTYRIQTDETDLEVSHRAMSCHVSQFTPTMVDDLHSVIAASDGVIYLRPFLALEAVHDDLFD